MLHVNKNNLIHNSILELYRDATFFLFIFLLEFLIFQLFQSEKNCFHVTVISTFWHWCVNFKQCKWKYAIRALIPESYS